MTRLTFLPLLALATFFINTTNSQNYNLVWSDEFEGTELNTENWDIIDMGGGFGNNEAQYYSPNNISVSNGKLIIEAKKEFKENHNYTSGKLTTQNKHSFKYGRMEAYIKMPSGDGIWPAFWMLGDNIETIGWPKCGEIDIMESKRRIPNVSSSALHYGEAWNIKETQWSENDAEVDLSQGFHLYAVEWDTTEIRFFVDDNNYYTSYHGLCKDNQTWCPFGEAANWKYYLILNVAVGGVFDNYVLPNENWTSTSMEVDYVKVYERSTGEPTNIKNINYHSDFDIHPNPVKNELKISNNSSENEVDIIITDINGKVIISQIKNFDSNIKINTQDWVSGFYFVKIITESSIITKKILKN